MIFFDLVRAFKNRKARPVSFHLRAMGLLRKTGIDCQLREEQDREIQYLTKATYVLLLGKFGWRRDYSEAVETLLFRGGEAAVFAYAKGRIWNFEAAAKAVAKDFVDDYIEFLLPHLQDRSGYR